MTRREGGEISTVDDSRVVRRLIISRAYRAY